MKSTRARLIHRCKPVTFAALALGAATAFADAPIPAAQFTFDVTQGGIVLPGCTPVMGTPLGGTCGSEAMGPGYAATSGGIGTPSYLALTPGGTALGTGTAVDATSIWKSGSAVRSTATMTYSFQATGPASVSFVPVDVISTALASVSGNATATLSLVVRDAAGDANIPHGVPDPDPSAPLLDLTAHCANGTCIGDWGAPGHLVSDLLCVVNGDNYTITITAVTTAGAGAHNVTDSASALLDPVIKLDPPYPTSCAPQVPLDLLQLQTGPGASTGIASATAVPEPSTFSLMALAVIALGLTARRRRLQMNAPS
jgi:hypothetical protein